MNIANCVDALGFEGSQKAFTRLLERLLSPAFGALPKAEVELALLDTLQEIGAVESDPGVYELVSKLKVTRSKARRLIYDRELRKSTPEALDGMVKDALKRPTIQKSGDLFYLEIENPLVLDHLRDRVRRLGYLSDGSFSASIVRLSLDAVVALVEQFLTPAEKKAVKRALVEAGAPDTSFGGVLKGVLRKLGTKFAAEAGEALMGEVADFMSPLVSGLADHVGQYAREHLDLTASTGE